uniref:Uncharacterized protein n=1 Tax=Picea sitchensis TaxID=3332 RepID=A9NYY2_PICSI|nr:unknown [Picea sitchensis]
MIADAGSMTSDLAKGSDAVTSVFEILDINSLINPEDHDGVIPEKVQGSVALNSGLCLSSSSKCHDLEKFQP